MTHCTNQILSPSILIVGASVRALAESAVRAGWSVDAIDLFADADLGLIARQSMRVPDYPSGLVKAASLMPQGPFTYTGALENNPDVIEHIQENNASTDRQNNFRTLIGNSPEVLRVIRNPSCWIESFTHSGFSVPTTTRAFETVPTDSSFLVKPILSAGGIGIEAWTHEAADGPPREQHLWQQRVEGESFSATVIITPSQTTLIGIARQLIGEKVFHSSAYHYCGSITAPFDSHLAHFMRTLADFLAERFGLLGAVGIDFVVDANRTPWIVEINPRPTASMELWERTGTFSLANEHFHSFGLQSPQPHMPQEIAVGSSHVVSWGKAIYFAAHDFFFSDDAARLLRFTIDPWNFETQPWRATADIPQENEHFRQGSPVLTFFACGTSHAACRELLTHRAMILDRFFDRYSC